MHLWKSPNYEQPIFIGECADRREADIQTDNPTRSRSICVAYKTGGAPRGCGGTGY